MKRKGSNLSFSARVEKVLCEKGENFTWIVIRKIFRTRRLREKDLMGDQ